MNRIDLNQLYNLILNQRNITFCCNGIKLYDLINLLTINSFKVDLDFKNNEKSINTDLTYEIYACRKRKKVYLEITIEK